MSVENRFNTVAIRLEFVQCQIKIRLSTFNLKMNNGSEM